MKTSKKEGEEEKDELNFSIGRSIGENKFCGWKNLEVRTVRKIFNESFKFASCSMLFLHVDL